MKNIKQIGIWMDHANAHLMEFADPMVTKIISSDSTHEEKKETLQKGESFMQRKNQQQEEAYYKEIGESIKGNDEVFIFGPTNARVELINILEADRQFSNIKFVTRASDKMTVGQTQAVVKDYFSER